MSDSETAIFISMPARSGNTDGANSYAESAMSAAAHADDRDRRRRFLEYLGRIMRAESRQSWSIDSLASSFS